MPRRTVGTRGLRPDGRAFARRGRPSSRWRALALAAALVAGAGACSSDGDGDGDAREAPAVPGDASSTTTSLADSSTARTTPDGVELTVVAETVITPATGCSMLTDQWRQANPGQEPPADLCQVPVDSRRFTATGGGRTLEATVPVPNVGGTAAAMAIAAVETDEPLTLVVANVSSEVASVTIASGSQPAADIVAPADGLVALAVLGPYDRVEARAADGRVLTTCFAEPIDDAGGQCLSTSPVEPPSTTTPG